MMRISSENRVRVSFRTCIDVSPSLNPVFSILCSAVVLGQVRALGEQQHTGSQRGHDKERDKGNRPSGCGNMGALHQPGKTAPTCEIRKGGGQRHHYTRDADQPQAFIALSQFPRTQPHAHLSGGYQGAVGGHRNRTQRSDKVAGVLGKGAARVARFEVAFEPSAVCGGQLRGIGEGEHLAGAYVIALSYRCVVHARIPFNNGWSALRPRYTRDFTVPSGAPVTTAISSNDSPSWKRRTRASRYSAATLSRPAAMRSLS